MANIKAVQVDEGLVKYAIKTANAMFESTSCATGVIVERENSTVKENETKGQKIHALKR
jgi:hypothetical protein